MTLFMDFQIQRYCDYFITSDQIYVYNLSSYHRKTQVEKVEVDLLAEISINNGGNLQ